MFSQSRIRVHRLSISLGFCSVLVAGDVAFAAKPVVIGDLGPVEHEVQSEYSHIRVRRNGDVRTMLFVRDNGQEAGETMLDLKNPHHLKVPYTQTMFASYLFRPKPEKVLIVGLGGGAMVRFLQHHQPNVKIDAIEIDPEVVRIADEYFGTKPTANVRIMTADGFDYLKTTESRYDAIFMDAFLKPSADTDSAGAPLRLKTVAFLKQVQSKVRSGGVVVFNLNPSRSLSKDLAAIRSAFSQTYVFRVLGSKNLVVVGSTSETRVQKAELLPIARETDRLFGATFSFEGILRRLSR